jgi:2'-5' RNA ligase
VFPRRSGGIHWVGVKRTAELQKLAERIASGLRYEGFQVEKRKFTPHITIGREVKLYENARITAPMASMTADHISLMRSDRRGGRLVYSEIASIPCCEKY